MFKKFLFLLLLLLILLLPVFSFTVADNIVLRLPDLYSFEFTDREVSDTIVWGGSDVELGQLFSDFMMGQSPLLMIGSEEEGFLLSDEEQNAAIRVRDLLNIIAIVGGGTLLIGILIAFFLVYQDWKEELRFSYRWSYLIFLILAGAPIGLYLQPLTRGYLQTWILSGPLPAEGVLPFLINHQFFLHWFLFRSILALALMITVGLVLWRVTKPRKIFERRPYTVNRKMY